MNIEIIKNVLFILIITYPKFLKIKESKKADKSAFLSEILTF